MYFIIPIHFYLSLISDFSAFEAHHKLSRKYRKFGSSFDAGRSDATYYLPFDVNDMFTKDKDKKEPTSLLQFLQYAYGPLLMRILIPDKIYPPTFSITFPKFKNPKYGKEIRAKSSKKKGMFCIIIFLLLTNNRKFNRREFK
jgi:hypothetical protein